MLSSIVLGLATFHLFTDKSTNAPVTQNEDWICLVSRLIPFATAWMLISLFGLFVSMMKKRFWLALLVREASKFAHNWLLYKILLKFFIRIFKVLFGYIGCFGGAIYFAISFNRQLEMDEVDPEELITKTQEEITAHGGGPWIPTWLDNIQKQSRECCGLITYRDYEYLWAQTPTRFPNSCCRQSRLIPAHCPGDLTQIPFPYTAASYIKVEAGCYDEINESIQDHILESYHNSLASSVFIALAFLTFLIVFVKRFLVGRDPDMGKNPPGLGDAEAGQDPSLTGQIIIATSSEIVASTDSAEGVPLGSSADSLLAPKQDVLAQQQQQRLAQLSPAPMAPVVQQVVVPVPVPVTVVRSQQSATKVNKTNAIFNGLHQRLVQQQHPDAATGEDMTIGAGNIGRHEVYVAQDSTDHGLLSETPQKPPQLSGSQDDVGDIVHNDQDSGTPPGSPGGRRKKVRRLGLNHHHHHHRQGGPERQQPYNNTE